MVLLNYWNPFWKHFLSLSLCLASKICIIFNKPSFSDLWTESESEYLWAGAWVWSSSSLSSFESKTNIRVHKFIGKHDKIISVLFSVPINLFLWVGTANTRNAYSGKYWMKVEHLSTISSTHTNTHFTLFVLIVVPKLILSSGSFNFVHNSEFCVWVRKLRVVIFHHKNPNTMVCWICWTITEQFHYIQIIFRPQPVAHSHTHPHIKQKKCNMNSGFGDFFFFCVHFFIVFPIQ